MARKEGLTAVFLFLSIAAMLSGQYRHIDTELLSFDKGLDDRVVAGLARDKEGFFWIATRTALLRYDGYRFYNPHYKLPELPPFNGDHIIRIFKAKGPEIAVFYFLNPGIIDIYNTETGEVRKVELCGETGRLLSNPVIRKNRTGEIFLFHPASGGGDDLYQLREDYSLHKLASIPADRWNGMPGRRFRMLYNAPGKERKIWIHDGGGNLFHYSLAGKRTERYSIAGPARQPQQPGPDSIDIHFLAEDNTNRIWLSYSVVDGTEGKTRHQMAIYRPEKGAFEPHPALAGLGPINKFMEIDTGLYLLLSRQLNNGGGYLYNEREGWIETMDPIINEPHINYGLDVAKLSGGSYFISAQYGLLKITVLKKEITTYLDKKLNSSHSFGFSGRGIAGDSLGNIYLGTDYGGWYHLDKNRGVISEIRPNEERIREMPKFGYTRNLLLDEEGVLWGSSTYWDPGDGKLKGLLIGWRPDDNSAVSYVYPRIINNIHFTSRGMAILDFRKGGMSFFDKHSGQFTPFRDANPLSHFREAVPITLMERRDSSFWIGADKGLFLLDPKRQIVEQVAQALLSGDPVLHIFEDTDETLWLATEGGGLKHYNSKTGQVQVFDQSRGLCNNIVASILPDGDGHLWVSTFNGLAYFDKRAGTFANFYTSHGLTHNEFNKLSFYRDAEGIFYFGGMNGFNAFSTTGLIDTSKQFATRITAITRLDKHTQQLQTTTAGLAQLKKVILPAGNRFLRVSVTSTDFSRPEENRYRYFLEGFHRQWQNVRPGNDIVFSYLPAGVYHLKAEGSNSTGVWSEQPAELTIKVREFFYKTVWFYLLLLALAAGIAYIFFMQFRLRQALKMHAMRTQISSDLHDEVGSSLTHLSMVLSAVDVDEDPGRAKAFLTKGNEILMASIATIRDVVWAIDSRNDQAGKLMDRMMDFAFDVLGAKGIDYTWEAGTINREARLPPLIRQNIYLIYKEAVANIVRHSAADSVSIDFRQSGEKVLLRIRNNGYCPSQKKLRGAGLSNMSLRAKRMGGEVSILPEEPWFTVRLEVGAWPH